MYGVMISSLRKNKKMSQKELSDLLGIGVSTISMWESEKREPDYKYLKAMAEHFGVSIDYILYGKADERKLLPADRELLDLFEQLPEDKKSEVIGIMKGIIFASSGK